MPRSTIAMVAASLVLGFVVGFLWHRYQLPPGGMGLLDGTGPHAVTKNILERKPDSGIDNARALISLYKERPFKIVMLGDSLTATVVWNELLGRDDVANRGIGSDEISNFAGRLDEIFAVRPQVVVVQGGINDIRNGRPVADILAAYRALIAEIRSRNATPVVHALPMTHLPPLNDKISAFNDGLKTLARQTGTEIVDLARLLSKDGMIVPKYTLDGVHLSPAGYRVWRDALIDTFGRLKI